MFSSLIEKVLHFFDFIESSALLYTVLNYLNFYFMNKLMYSLLYCLMCLLKYSLSSYWLYFICNWLSMTFTLYRNFKYIYLSLKIHLSLLYIYCFVNKQILIWWFLIFYTSCLSIKSLLITICIFCIILSNFSCVVFIFFCS